ncbi:MAG: glutamate-5-semialdehyde dehydrogenase [Pseudomonadota bacterium]
MSQQGNDNSIYADMLKLAENARRCVRVIGQTSGEARNAALLATANEIRNKAGQLQSVNDEDYEEAVQSGLSPAMLDRMRLSDERIESMAQGLEAIAALPDPLAQVDARFERPNGLIIERVRVPLGVIGIIYESRPNVTVDAGALCLKAGNAVILRGGTECARSNKALADCMQAGLRHAGLPTEAVQIIPTQDREAVGALLSGLEGNVDVIVPRGGRSLIERVQSDARVPVIGHLEGLCHVYVHEAADPAMAIDIVVNAKMRRTGICGAAETLLIDASIASDLLPKIANALTHSGCELRGNEQACELVENMQPAVEQDWRTEYLDACLSVRVVADFDAAVAHIEQYGSGHTEAVISADSSIAAEFFRKVDSAIVLHNASTQFADGGEFGMGAEIGIATGRIHARGPVGANELTSYQYRVHGSGQVRPG